MLASIDSPQGDHMLRAAAVAASPQPAATTITCTSRLARDLFCGAVQARIARPDAVEQELAIDAVLARTKAVGQIRERLHHERSHLVPRHAGAGTEHASR